MKEKNYLASENQMPNAKCQTQKGITLIALVITIIILLILAGTAISIAVNGNNIFAKANTAVNTYNQRAAQERALLEEINASFDGLYDDYNPFMVTITYNANGGSGTMGITRGANPQVQASTFTPPEGYSFAGWNTAAEGNGTNVPVGTTITANVTLYAQWTLTTYTITYNANGGSGTMTATTGTAPQVATSTFTAPAGYEFTGWKNGNNESIAVGTTITANVTLYAQWSLIPTYTITYNANGGSGTMTATTGTAPQVATSTFTAPAGYEFTGWKNGNNESVAVGTTLSADTTLYAQWWPTGWSTTSVASAYPSIDAAQKAPIPRGFVASSATGENTIATGLVIYKGTTPVTDDNVATAKTTRDQYVWIPVTNTSTWTDSYSTGDDMTEPKLLSSVSDERESATLLGNMQSDYTGMKNSVSTYGGFYISRYELNANGGSKKGQDVANAGLQTSNAWYGLYNLARQDITDGTNTVLKGHMIFGSEYDQVISFIGTEATQTHETTSGRIPKTPQQSGQTLDVMKNIHDLEGNVAEWTAQASVHADRRVLRGGNYDDAYYRNFDPASNRLVGDPTFTYSGIGARQSLYVAL